jgi:hypothetical protein
MHIFIWAGLKSHGAVVDGALHMPSAADLEHTDVVVIYKGDAGYLSDSQKGRTGGVRQTGRRHSCSS